MVEKCGLSNQSSKLFDLLILKAVTLMRGPVFNQSKKKYHSSFLAESTYLNQVHVEEELSWRHGCVCHNSRMASKWNITTWSCYSNNSDSDHSARLFKSSEIQTTF